MWTLTHNFQAIINNKSFKCSENMQACIITYVWQPGQNRSGENDRVIWSKALQHLNELWGEPVLTAVSKVMNELSPENIAGSVFLSSEQNETILQNQNKATKIAWTVSFLSASFSSG